MSSNLDSVQSQLAGFTEDLRSKIQDWFKWDKNEKTRSELLELIKVGNVDRLKEMMLQRQSFGTAGIRGIMESGFNGFNDLVIIQTSQGLAKYLKSLYPTGVQSIVLGFDGRYGSKRFAQLTANIFHHIGWKVYLYSRVTPTPFVPYGVRMTGSVAGVMVTASHNPKIYNGYKVYFENGAQIVSPHDQHIQSHILKNLEPFCDSIWNTDKLQYNNDNLIDPIDKAMEKYFAEIVKNSTRASIVAGSDLRIVYTALHGVGHECLTKVFSTLGLKNAFPVLSQKDPDPEFSTVVFPNPEEGQGVLDESIKTAVEKNATLIIANDPDSDRFAASELQDDGQWRVFNGNELGALFGWWCLNEMDSAQSRDDSYMLSSAVSSKILETMAKKEGIHWFETLTGFKWMGNHADELVKKGKKVLFAFEEAIGFMIGTQVLDKDGISATATAIQMATYLHGKGLNLAKQLEKIYEIYGYHYSINSYFICHDQVKIARIFNRFADLKPSGYIQEAAGVKVVRVRDLNRGFDSSMPDKKPLLPTSSSSFMLTLYFENGSVITFRTSGTEPKIKYYSEMVAKPDEHDRDTVRASHTKVVNAAVEMVLQPAINQLQAKKD